MCLKWWYYNVRFRWWILIWILFSIIPLEKCKYDNKTFGISQTYITLGCKERCLCEVINGTALANCSSLCNTPVDPPCRANTQEVQEFQQNLKGTNCSCPEKRCITGFKLFGNNYLQTLPPDCLC